MAKDVFLASTYFTDYDIGAQEDLLCAVTVTDECYTALKCRGYLLTPDEVTHFIKVNGLGGRTKARTYGGVKGFASIKEIKKCGVILTSNQVRKLKKSYFIEWHNGVPTVCQ